MICTFFLHPRWLVGISEPSTVWIIGVIGVFHMESKRKWVGGPKQNLTPMMQDGFMRRKWVERRMLRGLLNSKCQYVYCSVYGLVCFLVSWLFCLLVCFCVYIRACMTAERASLQRWCCASLSSFLPPPYSGQDTCFTSSNCWGLFLTLVVLPVQPDSIPFMAFKKLISLRVTIKITGIIKERKTLRLSTSTKNQQEMGSNRQYLIDSFEQIVSKR